MKTYEFSIIASGLDPGAEDFESRFYDAGCDDALVSFQKGHIIIDFAREAETIQDAIVSAVECVTRAGASIERIEPDPLVSLADIAGRSGLTRAAITNYAKGSRGQEFPRAVARVTSESPLWSWAIVALWLFKRNRLSEEEAIKAHAFHVANEVISQGNGEITSRIRNSLLEPAA